MIKADAQETIRRALDELRRVAHTDDHRAIRIQIAEVEKITHHLAEALMDATLKEALESKKLSEVL